MLLLVAVGCGPADAGPPAEASSKPAAESPAPLVRVARLELRPVRRTIETTSYLESDRRVEIFSKIAGRVREVLADEGQQVTAGQVLARLDDREARTELRQAQVLTEDRRVQHQLAKLEVEAAKQRVSQARIERDQAKSQHDRNLQIDPDLVSEQEIEDSGYLLAAAEEAVQVLVVQQQKAELEVAAARNAIDEFEARVEAQQIQLDEHEIKAPFDGVIAERSIRGGETIGASTSLFVVVDQDDLVSYLHRPQRELATIRGAKEVTFVADAVPDREFRAAIDVISPVIDSQTGSFRIRIRVHRDDDLGDLLRPGTFIRARILAEDEREALMVPKAAIVNEGSQAVVFVVRDGIAHRVVLTPGVEERGYVESVDRGAEGLMPNDAVIVSGQQRLVDHSAVEVARE